MTSDLRPLRPHVPGFRGDAGPGTPEADQNTLGTTFRAVRSGA